MTSIKTIYKILTEIRNEPSKNGKQDILDKYGDNELLKEVMKFLFDDLIVTGLSKKKIEKVVKPIKTEIQLSTLEDMLEYLKLYNSGKQRDIYVVQEFIQSCAEGFGEEVADMIKGIAIKDYPIGISKVTLNKVYGKNFIFKFDVRKGSKFEGGLKHGKEYAQSIKQDGCFIPTTQIYMADGTKKYIKDVKIGDKVLSFNENTKEISEKTVLNVFYNGQEPREEFVRFILENHSYLNKRHVTSTKEHKYFTPDGWKKASELKVGDTVYTYGYNFTEEQISVLIGAGLGDCSVQKDNIDYPTIRYRVGMVNKYPHNTYYQKFLQLFKDYKGTEQIKISGYGSEMIGCTIKSMHDLPNFLMDKNNIVKTSYKPNLEILHHFTPLSLAIYYMDDGSKISSKEDGNDKAANIKPTATFHMNRYDKKYVEYFSQMLLFKFGIKNNIRESKIDKKGNQTYLIYITAEGCEKLFEIITKYIPDEMRYKVPNKYHHIQEYKWWEKSGNFELLPRKIRYIGKHQDASRGGTTGKWDLEIEDNHTYFANGFAVHNCRSIILVDDTGVKVYGRSGKEIKGLQLIEDTAWAMYEKTRLPMMYDGELLAFNPDRLTSEELFKVTSGKVRKDGIKKDIKFIMFDCMPLEEFKEGKSKLKWEDRRKEVEYQVYGLQGLSADFTLNGERIFDKVDILYKGNDINEINRVQAEVEALGYEGTMLDETDAYYEAKRTKSLLKYKTFHTVDLRVLRVEEHTRGNKLGSIVVDYKGYELGVGSGFSDKDREYLWNNQDEIVGKIVEVSYFEESTNDSGGLSLRFPVFKQIRNDKDEVSYN